MAIVILGVGQLVLPPLAEQMARDRISRDGDVLSLRLSAVPAVELLFGDADSATVHLASFRASPARVAADIGQSAGVGELRVRIDRLSSGPLLVDGVELVKRRGVYFATGQIPLAALIRAVPLLTAITPRADPGGITLRGTAEVPFVGPVSADARITAIDGRVVLSGAGLLGSFLHLTVWSDPRVDVLAVSGRPRGGGIAVSARWRVS